MTFVVDGLEKYGFGMSGEGMMTFIVMMTFVVIVDF